jgi:chromosome segregation ATPase
MINIRQAESFVHTTRKQIQGLKSKIAKAETSAADLANKEVALATELVALKRHREGVRARLFDMSAETAVIENHMAELTRTLNQLKLEEELALKRKKEVVDAHASLEENLRKLMGNRTAPLKELLDRLNEKHPQNLSIG